MKRKFCLLLTLCLTLSLSACGGISQDDYDAVVKENESLQAQVNELQSELESLNDEIESLNDEKKSLADSNLELLQQTMDTYENVPFFEAWIESCFGDDSICSPLDDSYIQCIPGKTYEISDDGISEMWSDYLSSIRILGATLSSYVTNPTDNISIKFYDPSGVYIAEFTLKATGNSYSSDAIMINLLYADKIVPALTKVIE